MDTLLGFVTLTKGTEYLIAIGFLFAFLAFWFLWGHQGQGIRKTILRIVPLAVVALGFGLLASTCVNPAPAATTTSSGETPLLASGVLVEMYGPATFPHESHMAEVKDCATCHHHSGTETPSCSQCHAAPFDPDNLDKPGLARVYHRRCIGCHIESNSGPTDCTGCHIQATIPPLSISHPLSGRENCLSCHKANIPGVPVVPADHDGATNGVCQLCHQVAVDASLLASHPVPHGVAGLENCLLCHGEGIGGATRVPADHAGRTNDTCQLCHEHAQGASEG